MSKSITIEQLKSRIQEDGSLDLDGLNYNEGNKYKSFKDLLDKASERNAVVDGEYKNANTKIDMICKNGHEFSIVPGSFKRGDGCARCSGKCPIQAEEEFRREAASRGAIVVGDYKNNKTKIDMICKNGHEFSIVPFSYKKGKNCKKCSGNCPKQAEEEFRKEAASRGATVIGEYKNTRTRVDMICKNGHEFSIKPNNYKKCRQDCVICSNREKKYETFTASILDQLCIKYSRQMHVKTAEKSRFVDFVLPDYEVFLEVDESRHTSEIIEDIEREDNIKKALSNTQYKNFTFERVSATQGKSFEERTQYMEKRILEIINKNA